MSTLQLSDSNEFGWNIKLVQRFNTFDWNLTEDFAIVTILILSTPFLVVVIEGRSWNWQWWWGGPRSLSVFEYNTAIYNEIHQGWVEIQWADVTSVTIFTSHCIPLYGSYHCYILYFGHQILFNSSSLLHFTRLGGWDDKKPGNMKSVVWLLICIERSTVYC